MQTGLRRWKRALAGCRGNPRQAKFVLPAKPGTRTARGFPDPRFRGGDVCKDSATTC